MSGAAGGIIGGGTGGGAVASVFGPAVLSAGNPGFGGTKLVGMLGLGDGSGVEASG